MDLGLAGKRALVTGSTAGIGFAVAVRLAREKARVVLNGRTEARVTAALGQLREAVPGADATGVAADVSTAAGCNALIAIHPDLDVAGQQHGGLRAEGLRGHLTVNSVLPGPTASEGVGRFVAQMAAAKEVAPAVIEREFFRSARPSSLIQRFASPDEVAALIAFVCSAEALAVTGAALRVDGGVVRAIAWRARGNLPP